MHLAYSSLRNISKKNFTGRSSTTKKVMQLKYEGYEAACIKHQNEIAAIQQYFPNWKPAFQ